MTTTAVPTRSAYPRTVDDLIPHAQELADRLGTVPSRNQLMKAFRVGADKANALRSVLAPAATFNPAPAGPPLVPVGPGSATVSPGAEPVPGAPPLVPDVVIRDEMPRALDAAQPSAEPEPFAESPVKESPLAEPARRRPVTWPVLVLCLPAFVAIWGGWVEMGRLTGFGRVTLLPGISGFQINTAITLPIGVETYAAYALYVWLSGWAVGVARTFAKWSALMSLLLGALGQIAYHLMAAAGWGSAPWPITAAVSCIPVAVLGMGAGLAHLMHCC